MNKQGTTHLQHLLILVNFNLNI